MKRQLRALPLFGTLAVALSACQLPEPDPTPSVNGTASSIQSSAPGASTQVPTSAPDTTMPDTQKDGQTSATTTAPATTAPTTAPTTGPSSSGSDPATSSSSLSTDSGSQTTQPDPNVVPAPYAGKVNPLPLDDTGAIVAGGLRFKKNCGCHVANSTKHDPEAPELAKAPHSKKADDWKLWKISEGVAPKMGPFKDTFSETERWQIITYLRALAVKNGED